MEISEFINKLGSSDLRSLNNVLAAYQEARTKNIKHIEYFGYHDLTGNIFCVLEGNITIFSHFGEDVFYCPTDDENKEFHSLDELVEYLKK